MSVELFHVTSAHVLVLGFLLGVVFPALFTCRTPPSGNEAGVGAV